MIVNPDTDRNSKNHKTLRHIVTYGILWVWAGIVTLYNPKMNIV